MLDKINDQEEYIIADIRDKLSFKNEHIDSAINLSNENMTKFISETEKHKSIVVYCYHGNSSKQVAQFLVNNGFEDVYSLNGGYELWRSLLLK